MSTASTKVIATSFSNGRLESVLISVFFSSVSAVSEVFFKDESEPNRFSLKHPLLLYCKHTETRCSRHYPDFPSRIRAFPYLNQPLLVDTPFRDEPELTEFGNPAFRIISIG
jgi:hypothetical protein